MKRITNIIIILSIAFCYLLTCTGCKSKTDFSPYADGTYTAEEGHSHSHEHDDVHEHNDEHEHEHAHDDDDE